MNQIFEKIALQIPDLAALIILVAIFLKAMGKRDKAMNEMHEEHVEAMKLIHSEENEARHHSRQVIERCTEVMGEMTKAVERCGIGRR